MTERHEIAEHGSTSDDRGWTVREDGGVASHPIRPFRSHVRAVVR